MNPSTWLCVVYSPKTHSHHQKLMCGYLWTQEIRGTGGEVLSESEPLGKGLVLIHLVTS